VVKSLTEELIRNGTDARVLTRFWKKKLDLPYVTQIRTGRGEASGYFFWALRAMREINRVHPDIVHCHGLEGAVVSNMLRFTSTKTVFHLHNSLTREAKFYGTLAHRVGSRILKEACVSASIVICPTQAVKTDLIRNIPSMEDGRVVVVPNMVEEFHPWPREKVDSLKTSLGVSGKKVILYFGKVKRSKGIEDLCRAYELLGNKEQTSLIIGGAPTWTENFFNQMKREFPNVIFTGFVDDPAPYYQMADVFCIYTDSFEGGETFAISLAEAMSLGVPAVCSDNPIYREVTQNDAFFVEPKNPPGLSEQIRKVLEDPNAATKLAARARVTASERYSTSAVMTQIERIYHSMLQGVGSASPELGKPLAMKPRFTSMNFET